MGGTYAHAYTNTLQGFLMLAVALLLFAQGLPLFEGGFIAALRAVNDNYAAIYNPDSSLYFSFFSVFASGFIITFALMLQPHILTKVLYLRSEADLGKFIATTVVVGFLFTLVLFIGFFARVSGLEVSSQDAVVVEYLNHTLIGTDSSGLLLTFIMLTLLAAGMSTLDGILVSLSAMVVNDIVAPLSHNYRNGLLWSRWVLVGVGLLGMLLAWNSPPLIGLFAQKGVYGLAAASLVPMLFGVLFRQPLPLWLVFGASLIGLFGHFLLHLGFGIENPSISASYAILASLAYAFVGILALRVSGSRSNNP
jgi:SSS family solute:Na+ symporter/sodium/pantothenate symporter